jgi:two-component system sensor histidine kinase UhpB
MQLDSTRQLQDAAPATIGHGASVLLVEDNLADAVLTIGELKESPMGPFSVTHVQSVTDAKGRMHAQRFDAVVLDLGLPDSEGLATLTQVYTWTHREIPILVLTALDDQTLRSKALREGADDYLFKGFSPHDLRSRAVRYAIDRKRTERACRAFEQQIAMAAEAGAIGIFDWNLRTGHVTWSNGSAQALGLTAEEFAGCVTDFEKYVNPDDLADIRKSLSQPVSALESFHREFRVVLADRSERWIEGKAKLCNDDDGGPRMVGTIKDISDRKAAEEAARRRDSEFTRISGAGLTPRELQLLELIIAGMPNKNIAAKLNIRVTTVAKHRANLMSKTKARNAAELARMGTIAGIVAPNEDAPPTHKCPSTALNE